MQRRARSTSLAALLLCVGTTAEAAPSGGRSDLAERAITIARSAQRALRHERLKVVGAIDRRRDPNDSGLVGIADSRITTTHGHLPAKQLSTDPRFAAVFTDWFRCLKLKPGSVIGASFSGSFPALNLAVLAAAKAYGLQVRAVSSITASGWGANHPRFTWPRMERLLVEKGLVDAATGLLTHGGRHDRAARQTVAGRALVRRVPKRLGLPLLGSKTWRESVRKRFEWYQRKGPIAAYINVGGNEASIGRQVKRSLKPGRVWRWPSNYHHSVMARFHRKGIPVLHVLRLEQLVKRFPLSRAGSPTPRCRQVSHLADSLLKKRPLR